MTLKFSLKTVICIVCIWINVLIWSGEAFNKTTNNVDQFRVIHTEYGDIRGKQNVTLFNTKAYYSYRGIPYGKAPVNLLRFKPPEKPDAWTGVRDTLQYGNECPQSYYFSPIKIGNEDCLYLNVFVPETSPNKKLPVMVFIHGGGFTIGSPNAYGPDFLIEYDVILVTINYRLGVFGFLSLGNNEYSGNMGLKDQQLALKWINENIQNFGGDQNKITVFGESAGAASTHFHVINKKSQQYFQRAILQSGTVLNPWAIYSEKNHLKIVKEYAKQNGIDSDNYNNLIDFLQNIETHKFVYENPVDFYPMGASRKLSDNIWGPTIELKTVVNPFLTEYPETILNDPLYSDDIDIMIGVNSKEMYIITSPDIQNSSLLQPFDESFELQLPRKFLLYNYDSKEYKEMATIIRKHYFPKNDHRVNGDSIIEFNDLLSDIWFVYGSVESAKLHAKRSSGKTFFYRFDLQTNLNIFKINSGAENLPGASHADDLYYVFRIHDILFSVEPFVDPYKDLKLYSIELELARQVALLWTNFAKYGTPTVTGDPVNFKPIENNAINYVDITNNGLIAGTYPYRSTIKFWDGFYKKFEKVFVNAAEINKMPKDEL